VKAARGSDLSRYEGEFQGEAATSLDVSRLISELAGQQAQLSDRDRQAAIACYLSASEGWRNASQRLGGAFASRAHAGGTRRTGLSAGKEE
jgi:hypothetical protein